MLECPYTASAKLPETQTPGETKESNREFRMDRMSPSRPSPDGLPPLLMLDDKGKQHAHRPHILPLITA